VKKRITVITARHLSTCPRMLKAADALAEEGHVVSTRATPWASDADAAVLKRRRDRWQWSVVDCILGGPASDRSETRILFTLFCVRKLSDFVSTAFRFTWLDLERLADAKVALLTRVQAQSLSASLLRVGEGESDELRGVLGLAVAGGKHDVLLTVVHVRHR